MAVKTIKIQNALTPRNCVEMSADGSEIWTIVKCVETVDEGFYVADEAGYIGLALNNKGLQTSGMSISMLNQIQEALDL